MRAAISSQPGFLESSNLTVESPLPSDRGVARSVDEPGGCNAHVAMARRHIERGDTAPVLVDTSNDGSGQRYHTGFQYRFLDPSSERNLVVHRDLHHPAGDDFDVVRGAEVVQNLVRDPVRELPPVLPRRIQPAKHTDDGIDGLTTQRRQTINENHAAARASRLHRRGYTRRSGPDHANVTTALEYRRLFLAGDDSSVGTKRTVEHNNFRACASKDIR
jgi:hypothetical protein